MSNHEEDITREQCERRARECIDLAKQSTDLKARENFMALAEQWAQLANEMARLSSRYGPILGGVARTTCSRTALFALANPRGCRSVDTQRCCVTPAIYSATVLGLFWSATMKTRIFARLSMLGFRDVE